MTGKQCLVFIVVAACASPGPSRTPATTPEVPERMGDERAVEEGDSPGESATTDGPEEPADTDVGVSEQATDPDDTAATSEPGASGAGTGQKGPPTPCLAGEPYRQFDFWLGDWIVRNPDGEVIGENTIERAQSGCVLIEDWRGKAGGTGTSMNYVRASTGRWTQRWVSSQGVIIDLQGTSPEPGVMILEGTMTRPDDVVVPMRGTWRLLDDGRVEQTFEISKDGGETWERAFRGYYTKEPS